MSQERPGGSQIRLVRETLGLKLEEFSARAGINPSYLSRLERGQRPLTLPIAARILRALGARNLPDVTPPVGAAKGGR